MTRDHRSIRLAQTYTRSATPSALLVFVAACQNLVGIEPTHEDARQSSSTRTVAQGGASVAVSSGGKPSDSSSSLTSHPFQAGAQGGTSAGFGGSTAMGGASAESSAPQGGATAATEFARGGAAGNDTITSRATGGSYSSTVVLPSTNARTLSELTSSMIPERRAFTAQLPWPDPLISVCYELIDANGLSPNERSTRSQFVSRTVRALIQSTWQRATNLEFTGWDNCESASGSIRLQLTSTTPQAAAVGYPGWYQPRIIELPYPASDAEILYRFGRALGFGHEYGIDVLPGPCVPCIGDSSCTAAERPTCLPSGFCGRRSDHESIMAPPDCGGIESIRQFSAWDVFGARQVYGQKPYGSLVSAIGGCAQIHESGSAYKEACLGYTYDTLSRRVAKTNSEVSQIASLYLPTDEQRCLSALSPDAESGVDYAPCDSQSEGQEFRMIGVRLRGLGGLCVVAPSATASAELTTARCGTLSNPSLERWTVSANQIRLYNTDLCATIQGNADPFGTPVFLSQCDSQPEYQRFLIRAGRIDWQGFCFDVAGGLPKPGSPVILWSTCGLNLSNDDFYLSGPVSNSAGYCLTAHTESNQLATSTCNATNVQEWDFHF